MKILVVTGSSGGHIFPALSFLEALKDRHKEIDTLLVLPRKNIKIQLPAYGLKVKYTSISNIALRPDFNNLVALLNFFKGALESLCILLEFKPDIVVGFGCLNSVPMVIFAWLFRLKTLLHEQNVICGRSNKLLAKFADKVALSFAQTRDYLNISPQRLVLTGNPLRKDLKRMGKTEALRFFAFNEDKYTVLVMGGSQGAHRINACFLDALSGIPDKSTLQIIHISGDKDYNSLESRYNDLNVAVKLFRFLNQMQYAYNAADLVISRAGATTIAELINFALPAIIIPYPFAYAHQLANAKVLEKMGAAFVIKDSQLSADELRRILEGLLNKPDKIRAMRSYYNLIAKPTANDLLVEAALSLNK